MNSTKLFFALFFFSFIFISCDKEDEPIPQPPNIVETAQGVAGLSSLVAALVQSDAGLVSLLQSNGPFTVFAPSNEAFEALLDDLGDEYNSLDDFDTSEEKTLLANILKYHVVPGTAALSSSLSDGQTIPTAQGESLKINISNGSVYVDDSSETDAQVTTADVVTANGVVHIIDKVLLPMDVNNSLKSNIVETAMASSDLSSLVSALIQADAGLVDLLQTEGPFTVFAPSNEAFASLLDILGDDFNSLEDFDTEAEKALLANVLKYHVIAGVTAYSAGLTDGQRVATAEGGELTVKISGDGVFIGDASETDAQVTTADVITMNGVVHIIDKVLLPEEVVNSLRLDIVESAMASSDLSLLVSALIQADAGLVDLLQTEGPFTVFAPSNEAFASLLDVLGDDFNSLEDFDTEAEKTLLANVLKYHVIAGAAAYSSGLTDGQMVATAQGEELTVKITGDGVFIGDASETAAQVVAADVKASNGVVHVVNKVLLPEEVVNNLRLNIVETAMASSDLSSLVSALVQADAGLVDLLQTEGPFTVFAPSNEAFATLLDDLGNDFNSLEDFDTEAEKALLANILKYHVVSGVAAYSSGLTDGQMVTTAQGEELTVKISGEGVFIDDDSETDAQVVAADVKASNGVVHIINKVLLPGE